MSNVPTFSSGAAQSFREWSHAKPLSEALSRAEAAVRSKPREPQARWLLFELLCVLGRWQRALKQLQTWAGLSKDFDNTAHVMRGLIRAEHQRMEVFAGRIAPATVAAADAPAPAWMTGLDEALRHAAEGDARGLEASDLVRETALAGAPDTPGRCDAQPQFAWVTDADTRLGPVCEVILVGAYRWVAFADLASVQKSAPRSLLDLLWAQVDLVLRDGAALKGYMPMRYPVHEGERDALLTARETLWSDHGRTGVHGRGQKMWMTDVGDLSLLDLRHCSFGGALHDAA
ncbi:type VI secretion system accessory protein TagJ [Variovorax boronicumulans]|uniref:type VI secretion system accessory protein TagJ n=1 Tax=Variovorax boronicumulans TaxID=436515 RepID=UPI001C56D8B7